MFVLSSYCMYTAQSRECVVDSQNQESYECQSNLAKLPRTSSFHVFKLEIAHLIISVRVAFSRFIVNCFFHSSMHQLPRPAVISVRQCRATSIWCLFSHYSLQVQLMVSIPLVFQSNYDYILTNFHWNDE